MFKGNLAFSILEGQFGVCRLNNNEEIPQWVRQSSFISLTRTFGELSVVCSEDVIPKEIKCEKNWKILKIEGPLDFALVGILATVSSILAQAGISLFAISTFDTDYLLVKSPDLDRAVKALSQQGHQIV